MVSMRSVQIEISSAGLRRPKDAISSGTDGAIVPQCGQNGCFGGNSVPQFGQIIGRACSLEIEVDDDETEISQPAHLKQENTEALA